MEFLSRKGELVERSGFFVPALALEGFQICEEADAKRTFGRSRSLLCSGCRPTVRCSHALNTQTNSSYRPGGDTRGTGSREKNVHILGVTDSDVDYVGE